MNASAIKTGSKDETLLLKRPDLIAISGLVFLFSILYGLTLCPTVYWYDSAEFATASAVLGIPHPPGYPLYTLIGYLFTWLPVEPALAINIMSAFFALCAIVLNYIVIRQIGAGLFAALIGASTLGATTLFWAQAVVAEVYTPGIFMLLLILSFLLYGLKQRNKKWVVFAAFMGGLSLGVHFSVATVGLGLVVLVFSFGLEFSSFKTLKRLFSSEHLKTRFVLSLFALIAMALGACILFYIPWRAAMKPALNVGDPSTWDRFIWMITGGNYKGWFLHDYSFFERGGQIALTFYNELLVIGFILIPFGFLRLFKSSPLIAISWLLMISGNIIFFFNYNVHDLDVFFLPTLVLFICIIALGIQHLIDRAEALIESPRKPLLMRIIAAAFIFYPFSIAAASYNLVDRSQERGAYFYGLSISKSLAPNAAILNFTTPDEWKYDAVFSMYFQKVLKRRTDVEMIVMAPQDYQKRISFLQKKYADLYMYYPLPRVLRFFKMTRQGDIFRVGNYRSRALSDDELKIAARNLFK